jgi:hypothetical protein
MFRTTRSWPSLPPRRDNQTGPKMKSAVFRNRPNHRQWSYILIALILVYALKIFSTQPSHSPYTPDQGAVFSSVEDSISEYTNHANEKGDKAWSNLYGYGSSFRDTLASHLPTSYGTNSMNMPSYSIKILAYVFPQFHPIPENDKFWGKNFTEWENVNKQTVNKYGIPIMRPAKEVGQYNLLDISTRRRWTETLQNSS